MGLQVLPQAILCSQLCESATVDLYLEREVIWTHQHYLMLGASSVWCGDRAIRVRMLGTPPRHRGGGAGKGAVLRRAETCKHSATHNGLGLGENVQGRFLDIMKDWVRLPVASINTKTEEEFLMGSFTSDVEET